MDAPDPHIRKNLELDRNAPPAARTRATEFGADVVSPGCFDAYRPACDAFGVNTDCDRALAAH